MGAGEQMNAAILHGTAKGSRFAEGQALFDDGSELAGMVSPVGPLFKPFTGDTAGGETALESGVAGDRDRLLLEHLPTVRYIARRIHERLPQHVELDDLISAGVVGLIDAFAKFDHGKKVQFKSYAQFRIRGAILDSLRTLDWSPRELRRKGRAVEEAIRAVTQRLGRAPVEQEIAGEMELSLEEYQNCWVILRGWRSVACTWSARRTRAMRSCLTFRGPRMRIRCSAA